MEKRDGGGSHNWGTFEDEMKAEDDKNNVSTDGDNNENDKEKEKNENADQENAEPKVWIRTDYLTRTKSKYVVIEVGLFLRLIFSRVFKIYFFMSMQEEEPVTMTLEEWKAQNSKKNLPKFNTRKAGEGSDIDPKWKKTYAYKKEKETNSDDEEEEVQYWFFFSFVRDFFPCDDTQIGTIEVL